VTALRVKLKRSVSDVTQLKKITRAYEPLKFPMPSLISDDVNTDSNEYEVYLQDEYQTIWYGEVEFGTPSQTIMELFDTGSSNLWVPCVGCSNCETTLFDPQSSTTSEDEDMTFRITYGTGSVSGSVYKDYVSFSGADEKVYTYVECALTEGDNVFQGEPFGGIFGLGWVKIAANDLTPPFMDMIDQGMVDEPYFSFYFNTMADETYGEVTFGVIDEDYYTGGITYLPVISESYWLFWLVGAHVEQSPGLAGDELLEGPHNIIVDSGTSLFCTSEEMVNAIGVASGATYYSPWRWWMLPCDFDQSASGTIVLTLQGDCGEQMDIVLPISLLILQIETHLTIDGQKMCYLGVEPDCPNLMILGDTFMANFYTVFHVDEMAVGFAASSQLEENEFGDWAANLISEKVYAEPVCEHCVNQEYCDTRREKDLNRDNQQTELVKEPIPAFEFVANVEKTSSSSTPSWLYLLITSLIGILVCFIPMMLYFRQRRYSKALRTADSIVVQNTKYVQVL